MTDVSAVDYEDLELFAEVHRLVDKAVSLAGASVTVGSEQWWTATPLVRLASLLVVAEHHLLADPDRFAAEALKQASVAISSGVDWADSAHRLIYDSHAHVLVCRAELGPLAALSALDPVHEARWVATGSSEEVAA